MCLVLKQKQERMSSNASSPCAACKLRRQKCAQECIFAPYFPPDNPQKFANVHEVFGASNVGKILSELHPLHREDAVNSLAYEAEARLRNPVYGCVGLISILQQKLKQVQLDIFGAKNELAKYVGPSAVLPIFDHPGLINHDNQQAANNNPSPSGISQYNNMQSIFGLPQQQLQWQHMIEQQEMMMRTYEHQQQADIVRYNGGSGFDNMGAGQLVTASRGYDHRASTHDVGEMSSVPLLALGSNSYDNNISFDDQLEQQQPKDQELQQLIPPQQQQFLFQQRVQIRAGSEEGTSVGPSL